MNRYLLLTFTLVLTVLGGRAGAAESLDPEDACTFMEQEGFHGSRTYSEFKPGQFRCSTLRKPINRGEPAKSDVRYLVTGTVTEANRLVLELRMRAGRAPQQVLIRFSQHVSILLERAFRMEITDELSAAIRSATPGEWQHAGRRFRLERIHDRASTYDLVFSAE